MKNRLDVSANLAIWNIHAKYQRIRAIYLARAMGVVRNSPPHLMIGGFLYIYIYIDLNASSPSWLYLDSVLQGFDFLTVSP